MNLHLEMIAEVHYDSLTAWLLSLSPQYYLCLVHTYQVTGQDFVYSYSLCPPKINKQTNK